MTSKAESIAQAVVAALTSPAMTSVPAARIYRDLQGALAAGDLPAIVVELGDEIAPDPGGTLIGRKMRRVELRLQTVAAASLGSSPYASADPAVVEAHNRIAADPTLGGLAFGYDEGDTQRQREDAEKNIGSVTKAYVFQFHTTEASIE